MTTASLCRTLIVVLWMVALVRQAASEPASMFLVLALAALWAVALVRDRRLLPTAP